MWLGSRCTRKDQLYRTYHSEAVKPRVGCQQLHPEPVSPCLLASLCLFHLVCCLWKFYMGDSLTEAEMSPSFTKQKNLKNLGVWPVLPRVSWNTSHQNASPCLAKRKETDLHSSSRSGLGFLINSWSCVTGHLENWAKSKTEHSNRRILCKVLFCEITYRRGTFSKKRFNKTFDRRHAFVLFS